jgi:D-3-phosphoglycerate dehydrogenase
MPKVLVTDYAWHDLAIEQRVLAEAGAELIAADDQSAEALITLAREHQVSGIMTCWAQVPAAVIDASPQLRIVARFGIGLDNIDVAHCTQRGVVVTNVPDYCQTEVVEHTLALLLSLARKVADFHHATKQGRYELHSGAPLRRLAGQTLGIVGLGGIGRLLAERARALELEVLAATRRAIEPPAGVTLCPLDELLARSDYVSLHVPLTDQTRHLIGRRELSRMMPTACLINTARGGLVDHAALAEALAAGRLAGAALDVQETEPPDLSRPPYSDPRVIVTPHAAFASVESIAELRRRAARQVADLLSGHMPEHVVNPESAGHERRP